MVHGISMLCRVRKGKQTQLTELSAASQTYHILFQPIMNRMREMLNRLSIYNGWLNKPTVASQGPEV